MISMLVRIFTWYWELYLFLFIFLPKTTACLFLVEVYPVQECRTTNTRINRFLLSLDIIACFIATLLYTNRPNPFRLFIALRLPGFICPYVIRRCRTSHDFIFPNTNQASEIQLKEYNIILSHWACHSAKRLQNILIHPLSVLWTYTRRRLYYLENFLCSWFYCQDLWAFFRHVKMRRFKFHTDVSQITEAQKNCTIKASSTVFHPDRRAWLSVVVC